MNERKIEIGKVVLESGSLKRFTELETVITINFMRDALGKKDHGTVKAKIFNPRKFTVGDFMDLAKAIGCDPTLLWELAMRELQGENKQDPTEPK